MRHDKSWSFNQIMKLTDPGYQRPREVRSGVRDLSIIDAEDRQNVRFRKCREGLQIRIYAREVLVRKAGHKTCDLGHSHPVTEESTFCWFNMTLSVDLVAQLQEWLTDGHHKWRSDK